MLGSLALALLSPFWGGLEAGSYDVGFETIPLRDYSRPFRERGDDRVRTVRVAVWYPARAGEDAPPVSFGHYVLPDGRASLAAWVQASRERIGDDAIADLLSMATASHDRARRAKGSFPVILFGGGLEAPTYLNSILCEFLASHGYISIAMPSLPARRGQSQGYDALTVETLLRDTELVIHEMRDYPGADIEQLGLVGWGLSGVAHVLLQMKNPDIRAIASLDGATGYRYGLELLAGSVFFEPARTKAFLLHVTDSRDQTRHRAKSFDYYDSRHRGPRFFLEIHGAAPADLTTLGSVIHSEDAAGAGRRYALLCEYVYRFFDLAIHRDAAAADFFEVTPTHHGYDGAVLSKRP